MTIYVTRNALRGQIEKYDDAEATIVRGRKGDRHCAVIPARPGRKKLRFWPGEWHPTPQAAITKAEDLRQNLLASLAKQAAKAAALVFKAPR